MKTEPFNPGCTATVAGWLNQEENWKWVCFGSASQTLDPLTFRVMAQRPAHRFHLFYDDQSTQPIGIVALSEIDTTAKSASLWFVLGDKKYKRQGYTTRAVHKTLQFAFQELNLASVIARTLPENRGAIEILDKNCFQKVGIRRQCIPMDGRLKDQLIFDLLAADFFQHFERKKTISRRKPTKKLLRKTSYGSPNVKQPLSSRKPI